MILVQDVSAYIIWNSIFYMEFHIRHGILYIIWHSKWYMEFHKVYGIPYTDLARPSLTRPDRQWRSSPRARRAPLGWRREIWHCLFARFVHCFATVFSYFLICSTLLFSPEVVQIFICIYYYFVVSRICSICVCVFVRIVSDFVFVFVSYVVCRYTFF